MIASRCRPAASILPSRSACLGIACLRLVRKRPDTDVLDRQVFFHAPGHFHFEEVVLVVEEVTRALQRQVRPDPGQDQGRVEGLGDVVHGAALESLLLVFGRFFGGDEYDGDFHGSGLLLEVGEDGVTINPLHHDVEQNQVGSW